ncbi:unnamed protein product [Rotaria sp. Silwood2]|nr:unnamed protein product [Rotaria sp. Silwood2]CAF4175622.1 unnamed protein product [Rotaria sp. Silwood2]
MDTEQDSITIWIDRFLPNHSASTTITIKRAVHFALCKIDPYLITFHDIDKCTDSIENINENQSKVILIISKNESFSHSENLAQYCEEFALIDSIYILCLNVADISSFERFSKVRSVHTDLYLLCKEVNRIPTIRRQRHQPRSLNDFNICSLRCLSDSSTFTISFIQTSLLSNNNAQRQEAEYMYSLLLRDILIRTNSTEEEMISFFVIYVTMKQI